MAGSDVREGRKHTSIGLFLLNWRRPNGGWAIPMILRQGLHGPAARRLLLAQSEPLHDVLVAIGIVFLEVIEQATPLADQH